MIFDRCLLWPFYLHLIFTNYASADWPSMASSTIQLLGIFSDSVNTSKPIKSAIQARAMFKAAVLLSHQYNITVGGQAIGWEVVQTGGNTIDAFRNSCLKVSTSNIVGIVGPGLSRESLVIAPFAKAIGIPVISYSATNPDLSDRSEYPAFFRTIPSDVTAALAVVKLFMEYNWTSCVIIYQNDAFGSGGAKAIDEAFYKNGLTVTEMIIFDIATHAVRGDLKSLLTSSSSRTVIVWAESRHTELILQNALQSDVIGPHFEWILSDSVSLDAFESASYSQLIGLLTIRAVVGNIVDAPVNKTLLSTAYELWQEYEPESFPGSDNVDYYALFAFDATWTLIGALQEFCSIMTNTSSSCVSIINSSFCFDRHLHNSDFLFNIVRNRSFLGVSGYVEFDSATTDRINGTYIVAQNVQQLSKVLKYAPVSVWSDLNGWSSYTTASVIVWPGNTLTRPTGYAAISDTNIRIAMIDAEPFTSVMYVLDQYGQPKKKLVGYMADLVDLLTTKMGFIPNITVFPPNQSYNGLVDLLVNDVYDMIVADLTITAARRERVAFSSSIFDNSLRIITRKSSSTSLDLLAYLRPFSLKLWLALLIATIYAGMLISCFERHENEVLQHRSISSLLGLSMYYSIGTIVGYGADLQVKTAAGRLLTVGLYILCLISVAAYTANLASDLTTLKSKDLISGIDDIKNAKIASNRIGIRIGTSIEDYYLREISNGVRDFFPLVSSNDIFRNLLNGKIDVAIYDGGLLEYATSNVYCNLTLVGVDFDRSSFGIAVQKKWQYTQQLDTNLLSLRESSSFEKLKEKWFQGNRCGESNPVSTAMSIESMAGLFLTFGVISVLAMLLFLWTKRFVMRDYVLIAVWSQKILSKKKTFLARPLGRSVADCVLEPDYIPPSTTYL